MKAASAVETYGSRIRQKRQMKTPFQLETLENVYASDPYPLEPVRAELSEKLGLTDRQLQMWFCHRRLKEKKATSPVLQKAPLRHPSWGSDWLDESATGSGSGSSSFGRGEHGKGFRKGPSAIVEEDVPDLCYLEESSRALKIRAIAAVEAQLGQPLRQDGPILGVEFDPLPPDAFGACIDIVQNDQAGGVFSYNKYDGHRGLNKAPVRHPSTYQYTQYRPSARHGVLGIGPPHLYEQDGGDPSARYSSFGHGSRYMSRKPHHHEDHVLQQDVEKSVSFSTSGYASVPHRSVFPSIGTFAPYALQGPTTNIMSCTIGPMDDDSIFRMKRKRKSEDVNMEEQVQLHKKYVTEELGREDILKEKTEWQVRKGPEKHERVRRKDERKMIREKQRDEEKAQREQRRESQRREKMLQREFLKAEKRQQRDEVRRKREEAKQKAVLERATTRRFAREHLGLIEDEKLELMELAKSNKMMHCPTDQGTGQYLDPSDCLLNIFPPTLVNLKKPFAIDPWINSDRNVGDLLMVWKFLSSFTDVLGIWPFTLDELLQALHDHDSRLLSEVHIALLKVIIDDIEDVSCAPGNPSGTNFTVNLEGRHLLIIQGAYAWGFEISTWKHHLNALTWPEILRQLALALGLGPQLKEKNIKESPTHENHEVIYKDDIISILRNGSAAENAFAAMRGRGLTLSRRSRHRLTPGTVKFAAFHVLSVEGSNGITVSELAEKIQKSGLRDLTKSRAPEASIATALTRDMKIFQRTAPSTYCVRSPFRKDPAKAESVLSAAREKLHMFQNRLGGAEDMDNFGREGDDDGYLPEGCECNDMGGVNANNGNICSESSTSSDIVKEGSGSDSCSKTGKESNCVEDGNGIASAHCSNGDSDVLGGSTYEPLEIDESKSFESWVEGLTEGEYSSLSVEERLSILVALVGLVNESNSIRAILEDRLGAAAALKKQILADTDVDGKRFKEHGLSMEANGRSPVILHDDSKVSQNALVDQEVAMNSEGLLVRPPNSTYQEDKYASQRCRVQQKYVITHRAEGIYKHRSLPLGQDRRHNRYWLFAASPSPDDHGNGRVFVETTDGCWWVIDSVQAFDSLLACLDTRGVREYYLHSMLREIESLFKESLRRTANHASDACKCETTYGDEISEPSTSFNIQLGRNDTEKKGAAGRFRDLQRWIGSQCFTSLPPCAKKHGKKQDTLLVEICRFCFGIYGVNYQRCPSCNAMCGPTHVAFPEHGLQIRLLKAILALIEASIPCNGFHSYWMDKRRNWGSTLLELASLSDFMQALTLLENAIRRDYLKGFSTWSASPPWMPQTTAATALRLMQLDAAISHATQPMDKHKFLENGEGQDCKYSHFSQAEGKSCEVMEAVQDPATNKEDSDEDEETDAGKWAVKERDADEDSVNYQLGA